MATIVMVLAHGPGRPDGDTADCIELQACLTQREQLDADAHHGALRPWLSRHTRLGRPVIYCEITRLDGCWALESFGNGGPHLLEATAMRPGEIVRISRPDGEVRLYRIVLVAQD